MTCFNKQYSAIQIRRGSNSEFVSSNIILASGEPAYSIDNKLFKIGDGNTPWNNLSGIYLNNDLTQFTPVYSSGLYSLIIDSTGSGLLVFNDSPTFVGIPLAPTATSGTNTHQIATTAFVRTEVSNLVGSAPEMLDTLNELAAAINDDANFATTITNSIISVSGSIPFVTNSGDNRILTSDGSNRGINAESNLTFNGTTLGVSGALDINGSGNFSSGLFVNNIPVSVSGHRHSTSDIFAGELESLSALDNFIAARSLAGSLNDAVIADGGIDSFVINDFGDAVSGLLPVKNILAGDHVVISNLSGVYTVNASGTSSNIPQTLVLRDSLGNFVANEPTFNIVQLNPSSGVIEQDIDLNPAEIAWNSDQGTLDYGLIGNGTNLIHHIGQEIFYRVHNGSPSTLYAGMAVSASGVNAGGRRISVAPYVADGSVRENRFVGIVSADILTGETGYVTHFGFVRKLDTRSTVSTNYSNAGENWEIGDILYVDPTTPGKLTKFEPKHSISVAIITNVNANNGLIFVRPTSYGHLDDNHDVSVSGATNGQFLQYNSATDYWVPSSSGNFTSLQVNGTGVSLSGHTHTTSNITDFNSSVSGLLPVTDITAGSGIHVSSNSGNFTISALENIINGSNLYLWANFR